MLATYGAKYRSLKAPRKLQWKPNQGSVQLELTIGDQELEFNVSQHTGGGGGGGAPAARQQTGRQAGGTGTGVVVVGRAGGVPEVLQGRRRTCVPWPAAHTTWHTGGSHMRVRTGAVQQ